MTVQLKMNASRKELVTDVTYDRSKVVEIIAAHSDAVKSAVDEAAAPAETNQTSAPAPVEHPKVAPAVAAAPAAEVSHDGKIAISPRARRLAEKSGVDISLLAGRGSGPRGRIIERDVASAIASGEPLTQAAAAAR